MQLTEAPACFPRGRWPWLVMELLCAHRRMVCGKPAVCSDAQGAKLGTSMKLYEVDSKSIEKGFRKEILS